MKKILYIVFIIICFIDFSSVFGYLDSSEKKLNGKYCYKHGDSESKVDARIKTQNYAIKDAIGKHNLFLQAEIKIINNKFEEEKIESIINEEMFFFDIIDSGRTEEGSTICYTVIVKLSDPYIFKMPINNGTEKFDYIPQRNCFYYKNLCLDFKKCINTIIEDAIFNGLSKILTPNRLYQLIEKDNDEVIINFDDLMNKIDNKSLKKELLELKNSAIEEKMDTSLINDVLNYKKDVWGFKSGHYKIDNNNIIIKSGINAFLNYLAKNLLPEIKPGDRIELMAVGYTDQNPIINSISYSSDNETIAIIDPNGCPNDVFPYSKNLPPQPIYITNKKNKWKKLDITDDNVYSQLIGYNIDDNCELSFARGFEAIKYLMKIVNFHEKFEGISINFAYSGKGVDSNLVDYKQKRKISLYLRTSRFK